MTEDEKQAIRTSFAGKRVSQMTALERKVFDEDFLVFFASVSAPITSDCLHEISLHSHNDGSHWQNLEGPGGQLEASFKAL